MATGLLPRLSLLLLLPDPDPEDPDPDRSEGGGVGASSSEIDDVVVTGVVHSRPAAFDVVAVSSSNVGGVPFVHRGLGETLPSVLEQ